MKTFIITYEYFCQFETHIGATEVRTSEDSDIPSDELCEKAVFDK